MKMKMKTCPPGVICIENVTLFLVLITLFIVGYLVFTNVKNNQQSVDTREKIIINQTTTTEPPTNPFGFFTRPNYAYSNLPGDVLMNPYTPPLRDQRYLIPEMSLVPPGAVPINVSTNIGVVDTNYRQLGIITPLNSTDKNKILPLMGRPLYTSRQKFQYYTMTDQNNSIKLPIRVKGRSATNDYGVDELYSHDTVYVEGYNEAFKVTMYDNNTVKYLPFL